jgi:hypothetical protein
MKVGELVYKQAIEQGYNPDLFKGLVSPLENIMESYRKVYESLREPLARVTLAVDSIQPQIEAIQRMNLSSNYELIPAYMHNEQGELTLPKLNKVQDVRIINAREIAQVPTKDEGESFLCSYKLPKNATWESLYLKFLDGHVIKVEYPGMKTRKFDFKDMGFLNGKTMRPNLKWVLLQAIAGSEGALTNANWDKKFGRNVKYELNEKLKTFFGMNMPPIPHYTRKRGYRPLFTIKSDK